MLLSIFGLSTVCFLCTPHTPLPCAGGTIPILIMLLSYLKSNNKGQKSSMLLCTHIISVVVYRGKLSQCYFCWSLFIVMLLSTLYWINACWWFVRVFWIIMILCSTAASTLKCGRYLGQGQPCTNSSSVFLGVIFRTSNKILTKLSEERLV